MTEKTYQTINQNEDIMASLIAQAMAYHDDRSDPITYQENLNRATHKCEEKLGRKVG